MPDGLTVRFKVGFGPVEHPTTDGWELETIIGVHLENSKSGGRKVLTTIDDEMYTILEQTEEEQ